MPTDPVRVAVVSSVHRWNDTRIFVRQASSLSANGYDVILAAIGDQASPFVRNGVRVIPLRRQRRFLRWINWLAIVRIVVKERAAVVHGHDPELIPLLLLFKLIGRKTVCDVHENVSQQILDKEWIAPILRRPLSALFRSIQRRLPRLVDAVVLAEDSYVREFPAGPNVITVRNFPILPPTCKDDYASNVLRLIYVGDVRKVRGIDEYVAIAGRLVERKVPVKLQIAGSFADPQHEQVIRRTIEARSLESCVTLLGRVPPEAVPELILQADVGLALLHPIGNYRESYPTKMFEYMAAGIPVVASRFALWENVLSGNDCGSVVDPLNVEEAVDALCAYWSSDQLRARHGQNGRSAVIKRYQWALEVPRLLAIYQAFAPVGAWQTERRDKDARVIAG